MSRGTKKSYYETLNYLSGKTGQTKSRQPKLINILEFIDKLGPDKFKAWFDKLNESQQEYIKTNNKILATYKNWQGLHKNPSWKWCFYDG